MNANFASFLYLVSGILFILALRGLSHPTTSRQGNTYGMIGMGIAIVTTLALATPSLARLRADRARPGHRRRRRRRHRPAHRHDLDAAAGRRLPLAWSAWPPSWSRLRRIYAPTSFGIGTVGDIHSQALVEMALGVAIGAITFTGSVIAFLKLDGRMSGKPILLPMRHVVNAALGIALVVLIVLLVTTESQARSSG